MLFLTAAEGVYVLQVISSVTSPAEFGNRIVESVCKGLRMVFCSFRVSVFQCQTCCCVVVASRFPQALTEWITSMHTLVTQTDSTRGRLTPWPGHTEYRAPDCERAPARTCVTSQRQRRPPAKQWKQLHHVHATRPALVNWRCDTSPRSALPRSSRRFGAAQPVHY